MAPRYQPRTFSIAAAVIGPVESTPHHMPCGVVTAGFGGVARRVVSGVDVAVPGEDVADDGSAVGPDVCVAVVAEAVRSSTADLVVDAADASEPDARPASGLPPCCEQAANQATAVISTHSRVTRIRAGALRGYPAVLRRPRE